jgi:adenylate cyclase
MNTEDLKRRLTAILSADVEGYSRLMGEDEDSTVRTLTSYRKLISSLTERYNGRVVDSPGDNLLAEFGSVRDAVRCAVEIQEELKMRNDVLPDTRRLEYRIGVNLGDVIKEGDRIYGDGVNIAARLESLAEPGGICISGVVYSQVKNRLSLEYEYLGKRTVKNISEPVPVYRVLSLPKAVIRPGVGEEQPPSLSDKPSIAVLPFVNISGDPEQEYFSDGMTEELINALANVEELKVISRTSSFFFKGKDVDLRTVGEKLKVDNVIEGSVRKAGNKLRITAQLIKVTDDTHLWSEAYDRELEDVFAIQDEISNAIVDSFKIRLFGKEKEPLVKTHTENMDAYESFIKGRYFYLSFMEGSMEKALHHYKQAITIDSSYAPAYSAIAQCYHTLPIAGHKLSKDDAYAKAKEAINTALEIDSNLPEAYATLGLIKWLYEWDWKGAEKAFETALRLNPGLSKPHYDYAFYLAITGNADRSILEARKAVEIDPLYGIPHYALGAGLFAAGQFEQALKELRQGSEMMPTYLGAFYALVAIYIEKGMLEEAMDEINKRLELFSRHPMLLSQMGRINVRKGEIKKAQEILNELLELSKKEYVSPFAIAPLYIDLGEIDKAYEYLEEGYEKRDIWFAPSTFTLIYRYDARFDAFFKRIGL